MLVKLTVLPAFADGWGVPQMRGAAVLCNVVLPYWSLKKRARFILE
jgi:hypothetical protein